MIALQCYVSFYNTTVWISHSCLVSRFSSVCLIATLWMVACQAPPSKAFSRQEHWSGLPGPPPGDLPKPRMELRSLVCSALVGRFFTASTTWETPGMHIPLPSGASLPCASHPIPLSSVQFSSVQSLSRVRLSATPWIAARQASLSITTSRSSLRLAPIESVMPSSHLILGRPLLLLPPVPPYPSSSSKSTKLSSVCHTAVPHEPSVLHTVLYTVPPAPSQAVFTSFYTRPTGPLSN